MGLNRKIINSPKSRLALEQKLAKFFGFEYSVVFGRGRSALTALLEVVSKGQELNFVIPSNICPSIVASASTINARIIAVDVEKETGLPSDSAFKKAIMSSKGPGVFMPTYLYGFDRSYKKAISSARNRGWFVLENDCCGTLPACKDYKANSTRGDAVLVSFGGGKPIDAGGGGAVISNNAELIQDLHDELVSYQILDQSFVKMEEQLIGVRRLLQSKKINYPKMGGLYERFLPYETHGLKLALPEIFDKKIMLALDQFDQRRSEKLGEMEEWKDVIVSLSEHVKLVPLEQPSPWRFIFRIKHNRDSVVEALRFQGYDVGTNYPPLKIFFPNMLASSKHNGGSSWGQEVVNLWLGGKYRKTIKSKIVDIIAKSVLNQSSV